MKTKKEKTNLYIGPHDDGLSVLAVSDPSLANLAAAVAVPGLAHLLEHVIFRGSDKFPDEKEVISCLIFCNAN